MLDSEQIDNWEAKKLGPMDYGTVVSAKKLKGSGLTSGDKVMVMGTKQVPASAKDPYITRTLLTVVKLVNDLPAIPKQENDYVAYLVDPRSLEKVSSNEHKRLSEILTSEYSR